MSEYLASGQTRCVNQVRNNDASKCYSTITCSNPDQVVCNGECIENEIYFKPLKECPFNYPFLCPYNECTVQASDCTSPNACGDGQSFLKIIQKLLNKDLDEYNNIIDSDDKNKEEGEDIEINDKRDEYDNENLIKTNKKVYDDIFDLDKNRKLNKWRIYFTKYI